MQTYIQTYNGYIPQGIYNNFYHNLLDVTLSNPLPHPLSPPPIPLCVIQVKDLVAKQHPTYIHTYIHT